MAIPQPKNHLFPTFPRSMGSSKRVGITVTGRAGSHGPLSASGARIHHPHSQLLEHELPNQTNRVLRTVS